MKNEHEPSDTINTEANSGVNARAAFWGQETLEAFTDRAIAAIGERFRTFGGGRDSTTNPMAHALRDQPLQFAAGVDVRAVVELIIHLARLGQNDQRAIET